MHSLTFLTALADRDTFVFSGLTFLEGYSTGETNWLLAGSSATNTVSRFRITENEPLEPVQTLWTNTSSGFAADDAQIISRGNETRLVSIDVQTGVVLMHPLGPNAALSSPLQLLDQGGDPALFSAMIVVSSGNSGFIAGAGPGGSGIAVYSVSANWRVTLNDQVADTGKTASASVSDVIHLQSNSTQYVIAASQEESGLTCYRIDGQGDISFTDSIASFDGLWVSGVAQIAHVLTGGLNFVIGLSPQSSSLFSVRLNEHGVFFVTDIEHDTLDTRFQGATSMDVFQINNRSFAVTGGSDEGLSLFEVLPDGHFLHHQSIAQSPDWQIGAIETVAAITLTNEVQVFVSGASTGGIAQFRLPLSTMGLRHVGGQGNDDLTAQEQDDLLLGYGGNDILRGGAGDDTLIAGDGSDTLVGGSGEDVFIFQADGQQNEIRTFQHGIDRIDLSDWGMIYDHHTLDISAHANGATLAWRDETLNIRTDDGHSISPAEWTQSDFIF